MHTLKPHTIPHCTPAEPRQPARQIQLQWQASRTCGYLSADYPWPRTVCRWPPTVCRWPPTVCRWPPTVCRWPPTVCRWPPTVSIQCATPAQTDRRPGHGGQCGLARRPAVSVGAPRPTHGLGCLALGDQSFTGLIRSPPQILSASHPYPYPYPYPCAKLSHRYRTHIHK